MTDAGILTRALVDPSTTQNFDAGDWTALIAMARAEQLMGSLAHRLDGLGFLPEKVAQLCADARRFAEHARRQALWEAEMSRRVLAPLGEPVVLLKGTAYVAAGLSAGVGRSIGDLDILVSHEALDAVERALTGQGGWEWVKEDAYDDAYYRDYMHELPPLIHKERDRMIDVHHTVLPLTAKPTPDAVSMIADSVELENGLRILSPADMVCHSAAHLFADGDLAGGLRNLWDIDQLLRDFGTRDGFWKALGQRAERHQLAKPVARALRLAEALYETPLDGALARRGRVGDALYIRRLLARDDWGRETRKFLRLAFYIRSHWLRMPPLMLIRHLWTKWRKGQN
ncbi:nucleotidyltransferase domain-containing protein [Parasphingopyxis lamellibrachiae]|uniref:Putative nucleotidyltransferase-like protein n=1 Tax=Parasphingopyxis lamellibrachiae TaxID=680125 RepID=A0A3D9FBS6_9SPHN|nr:nucleotidyltransferase family protein [Parasphingopyxis lamellibrachiae]RED15128.1 putative nucleotidyltransferase-like protein [Parasphingopyxis lamellibrachiae]